MTDRTEVKPYVTSMPTGTQDFQIQTGGSARQKRVPYNVPNRSYEVTGVPGHTHNASAVMSVLVDNTEVTNLAVQIHNTWVENTAPVVHALDGDGNRFTDSAFYDDDEYDRAIERGIGSISIVPENCHQEITEPVREIFEIRTLVTPRDRLETLTYVEEVGGYVDQITGEEKQDAEFPDIYYDMFHARTFSTATTAARGRGDQVENPTEFRFEADGRQSGLRVTFNRAGNNGVDNKGYAIVAVQLANTPIAYNEDDTPFDGILRFRYDLAKRLYYCDAFRLKFARLDLVAHTGNGNNWSAVDTKTNVYVEFPRIETQVTRDGQCVLASNDRPLQDQAQPLAVVCSFNPQQFGVALYQSEARLYLQPFRVVTGMKTVVYGGATRYWNQVAGTTLNNYMAALAVKSLGVTGGADGDLNIAAFSTTQGFTNMVDHQALIRPAANPENTLPGFKKRVIVPPTTRNLVEHSAYYGSPSAEFQTEALPLASFLSTTIGAQNVQTTVPHVSKQARPFLHASSANWAAAAANPNWATHGANLVAAKPNMGTRARIVCSLRRLGLHKQKQVYADDGIAGEPYATVLVDHTTVPITGALAQFHEQLVGRTGDPDQADEISRIARATITFPGALPNRTVPWQSQQHYRVRLASLAASVQVQTASLLILQTRLGTDHANIRIYKAGTGVGVDGSVDNASQNHGYVFYNAQPPYGAHALRATDTIADEAALQAALTTTQTRIRTATEARDRLRQDAGRLHREFVDGIADPDMLFDELSRTSTVVIPSHVPVKHNNQAGTVAQTGITRPRQTFAFPHTLRFQFTDQQLAWQPCPYYSYYLRIYEHLELKRESHGGAGGAQVVQALGDSLGRVTEARTRLLKYEPGVPLYPNADSTSGSRDDPWYTTEYDDHAMRYRDRFFTAMHVGTSTVGALPEDFDECKDNAGNDLALRMGVQQETSPFQVFCQRTCEDDEKAAGQVSLTTNIDVGDLMDLTTVLQTKQNADLVAGAGGLVSDATARADATQPDWQIGRRHFEESRSIRVTSVGEPDTLAYRTASELLDAGAGLTAIQRQSIAFAKMGSWEKLFGHGSATSLRVRHKTLAFDLKSTRITAWKPLWGTGSSRTAPTSGTVSTRTPP